MVGQRGRLGPRLGSTWPIGAEAPPSSDTICARQTTDLRITVALSNTICNLRAGPRLHFDMAKDTICVDPRRSPTGVIAQRCSQQYDVQMVQRGALANFVDELQLAGRLTFTRDEAKAALGVSADAIKLAVLRLSKRGRLVTPRRGFYVIVPLECRAAGAPPMERWLPELLRFHGVRATETVAEGGGVVVSVDRALRATRCGPFEVRFRVRRG